MRAIRPAAVKLVAGAGYGGYESRSGVGRQLGHSLGPRPAHRPPSRSATGCRPWRSGDAGWLAFPASRSRRRRVAGRSASCRISRALGRGAWAEAAAAAGIDPDRSARRSARDHRRDRPLPPAAQRGACTAVIVADALRVPWVAIAPLAAVHRRSGRIGRRRWISGSNSIRLAASSLPERLHASRLAGTRAGRRLLRYQAPGCGCWRDGGLSSRRRAPWPPPPVLAAAIGAIALDRASSHAGSTGGRAARPHRAAMRPHPIDVGRGASALHRLAQFRLPPGRPAARRYTASVAAPRIPERPPPMHFTMYRTTTCWSAFR